MADIRKSTRRPAAERKNGGDTNGNITTPRMAAYDGIYSSSYRFAGFTPDKLLSQKGWDVPEDMLNMAACRAPFNLKRYSILSQDWEIVPAVTDPFDTRNEQATYYAGFVRWCLTNIESPSGMEQDFRNVLFEMLRACWDGFRVSEIGYEYLEDGPYQGLLGYNGFYAKHSKQIGFEIDPRTGSVLHITSYTPGTVAFGPGQQMTVPGGYDFDVPVERCALYTYNGDANLPFGMGDWRACYKHSWSLDNINRFWIKALERWGGPVLIAQGSAGGNLADVASTLDNIRDGGSAVLPDNVKFQLVQAATGVFDGYRMAAMWHEQQIAKNIQSNTLSTGEGARVGSMALGEVHQDTGETVYDYIRRGVEGVVNTQIIRRLCRLNFADFDMALCPRLVLGGQDEGDRLATMQMYDIAIKDGVVSKTAKFIREDLGMPPLDPEEQKQLEQEAQAAQEAQQQLADAKLSGRATAMNDHETARALDILTRAISARMQTERIAA
jgi:Protein of unknown function (DUF935)